MTEHTPEPHETPYPYAPPNITGHASEGSLYIQLDVREIIERIGHTMRCERPITKEDGSTEWVSIEGIQALINEKGMYVILGFLESRLNKIFQLSYLHEDQIDKITLSCARNIIESLRDNWNIFQVRDYSAGRQIVDLVVDTIYATLRKAKDANYLDFLSKTQVYQELNTRNTLQRGNLSDPNGAGGMADRIRGMLFGRR